jgi:anti-sigma B factor antagonist
VITTTRRDRSPYDSLMSDEELIDGIAVRTEHDGRRTIMTLTGELDLVSAPRLRNAIASLRGEDIDEVIVDLADLTYIDSVGIGLLVASRRRLDSEGRSFAVRNPAPQVRRLLEITGLVEYLGLN